IEAANNGAGWLDVRYPEDYARLTLRNSRNLPLNVLRLQQGKVPRDGTYVVCSEEPERSAVGAFLLLERGFNVKYLAEPISALADSYPALVAVREEQDSRPASVVAFPGVAMHKAGEIIESRAEGSEMDEQQMNARLENTIDRIDRLYSQKEFE